MAAAVCGAVVSIRRVRSGSNGWERLQAAGGGAKPAASGLRRRWAATSPALGQNELEGSVCLAVFT
jgi:hypothetical protein